MKSEVILNVVIYYDNKEEVAEYASKLSKQEDSENIFLAIVVNKITNFTIEELETIFKGIDLSYKIFTPNENLGYMNGLVYGYKKYVEEYSMQPKWVVMSNTDISYKNNDFFNILGKKSYSENIWCVAPSVYSTLSNSYSNPHYKDRFTVVELNRRISIFKKPKFSYYYMKLANIKAKFSKREKEDSTYVYSVHGCYFIINNDFAKKLSEQNYGALMYSEEFYIAELVRKYGKKCFYDSTLEIIHSESSVTGKLNHAKRSRYFVDSLKLIKANFF